MAVVLVVALVMLSGALLAPGLLIGPSLDAAVFSHVGGRLLDGVPLYLGAWDHKPPGIYLASAAARTLLGWLGSWTGEWLLSVAATAGIGVAVAAALRRLEVNGWPRVLGAAAAVVLAGEYLLALGGGLTEPLATVLVAVGFVGVLQPAGRWRMVAICSLAGAALLVSPQVLPGALAIIALAVAAAPASARASRIASLGAGMALPLVGATAWLAVSGTLPAALDAVLGYTAAYRAASGDYGLTLGAPVASWTALVSLFLVTPVFLGVANLPAEARHRRRAVLGSLVWVAGWCLLAIAQGRFYAHYAIPLAAPLGILAGLGLQRSSLTLHRQRTATARAMVLAPMLATLALSTAAGIVAAAMQLAPVADQATRMQAVAERLGDLPGGTLLVWGNAPRLYDLASRDPATRYSYFYPLTTAGYSTPAMIDEMARELAANPPAAVVDAGSTAPGQPGFLPLLIPRAVATDGRDLDLLDPLRDFVAEHYDLAATVSGWPVYVLRAEGAP